MRRVFLGSLFAGLLLAAPLAGAQKKTIQLPNDNPMATLKPGPGRQVVINNCSICHSTDYIVRQPKAGLERWQAEVEKMIKVMGAPASQADAKVIARYIATHYGTAAAPAKPPKQK